MAEKLVGVAVSGPTIREIQAMILRAEELGIHAAWMTTGGARPDSITSFAATAGLTERIKLGTSIVPTYPRHPLVMVQQAQIVATLAPGRFRAGRRAEPPPNHRGHGHRVQRAAGPPARVPANPQGHPATGAGGLRRRALHGARRHPGAAGHRNHGVGIAHGSLRAVRRGVGRGDKLDLPVRLPAGRGAASLAGRGAAGRTGGRRRSLPTRRYASTTTPTRCERQCGRR